MNRKQRRAENEGQRTAASAVPALVQHAGQAAEAERLCRQVLAADAHHADSLYLQGVVAFLGMYQFSVQKAGGPTSRVMRREP